MVDYFEIEMLRLQSRKELDKLVNDKLDSNELYAMYWAKLNKMCKEKSEIVLFDHMRNINFDKFNEALDILGIKEFIYFNRCTSDVETLMSFIENGFEIVGVKEY